MFLFNDTATTEIYTLSLHDALPIWSRANGNAIGSSIAGGKRSRVANRVPPTRSVLAKRERAGVAQTSRRAKSAVEADRKSTRLNSSHANISDVVFCLKKKTYRRVRP